VTVTPGKGAYPMRMASFGLLAALALVFMAQTPAGFAGSEIAGQFVAASLPNPSINRVVICHGFACKFRTMIAFGPKDHVELRKIMAKITSPEAERAAIARAVAWYERRIAPDAGTAGAKARSTESGDPSQIDCVESSLNTTSALLMLQGLGLLRYHRVEPYVSRMLLDLVHFVHSTAVLYHGKGPNVVDLSNQIAWVGERERDHRRSGVERVLKHLGI
jgi:hypothetical protein